jgi:cytochrome P450
MPAWSWSTGHLIYFYKHNRGLPPLASINLAFLDMASDFKDDEMFLLDIWPLSEPMLVIFNPEAAIQVCQKLNLPKGQKNETMIRPITGGITLLSMNGEHWKTWRTLLNPGFSTSVMMEQVPNIVDSVSSFCGRLKEHVNGGIVCLDHLTTQLTFEIILKVSL